MSIAVLLVEDEPGYTRFLREVLGEDRESYRVTCAATLAEALAAVAGTSFDVVLLDLGLPDADGNDVVTRVRAAAPRTPIVVLSGTSDVDVALANMRIGAQEYLVKGQAENVLLPRAIRYAIERKRIEDFEPMMLSIVGHDLRTPLNTVSLGAHILSNDASMPAARKKTVDQIARAAMRATSLVNDLLDLSRSRLFGRLLPIERKPTDVAGVIRQVVDEFAFAHGQDRVQLDVEGDLTGELDASRVAQAVQNLLRNANEHGGSGQRVTVRAVGEPNEIHVSVHNFGEPIPADRMAHLFEPNARGGSQGSGLGIGLHIVNEIALAHGGRVTVTSSAAEGTRFWLALPRAAAPHSNA